MKYAVCRTLNEYGGDDCALHADTHPVTVPGEFVIPPAGRTGFITRVTFAPVMVLLLYVAFFGALFVLLIPKPAATP